MPAPTDPWSLAVAAVATAVLIAVAVVDVRERRVPDAALAPATAAIVVLALLRGSEVPSIARGALGAFAFGLPLLVLSLVRPDDVGMGDAKLAGFIGLAVGSLDLALVGVAALVGILTGGLAAVAALARGRGRRSTMPFAPALAVGALMALALAVWS